MRLYLIVDCYLSKSQKAVQAAHAAAQYVMDHPNMEWKNGTIVILDHHDLKKFESELIENNIDYSKFIEPYWNNKLTALAAYGIMELTKDLPLI